MFNFTLCYDVSFFINQIATVVAMSFLNKKGGNTQKYQLDKQQNTDREGMCQEKEIHGQLIIFVNKGKLTVSTMTFCK